MASVSNGEADPRRHSGEILPITSHQKRVMVTLLQELLSEPNLNSPAQSDAFTMLNTNRTKYFETVRQQALKYPPVV